MIGLSLPLQFLVIPLGCHYLCTSLPCQWVVITFALPCHTIGLFLPLNFLVISWVVITFAVPCHTIGLSLPLQFLVIRVGCHYLYSSLSYHWVVITFVLPCHGNGLSLFCLHFVVVMLLTYTPFHLVQLYYSTINIKVKIMIHKTQKSLVIFCKTFLIVT